MITAAQAWAKGNGSSCRLPNQQLHGIIFGSYLMLPSLLCSPLAQSVWEELKSPSVQSCTMPLLIWLGVLLSALSQSGHAWWSQCSLFLIWPSQASAAWWGGVLFWFISKWYVASDVTSSSVVFPVHLYPRMMQNTDPVVVSLLTDFWYSSCLRLDIPVIQFFFYSHPLCRRQYIVGFYSCHSTYSAAVCLSVFVLWFSWASSLDDPESPCLHLL